MTVAVDVGKFTIGAGQPNPTVVNISLNGLAPQAIFFWSVSGTDTTGPVYTAAFGAYAPVGSNYSCYADCRDAQTPSSTARGQLANHFAIAQTGTALLTRFNVTAVAADQFTISYSSQESGAIKCGYLALANLSNAYINYFLLTTTNPQAITGLGFQPDAIIFFHVSSITAPPLNIESAAYLGLGFASGAAKQGACLGKSADGANPSNTGRYQVTDHCILTELSTLFVRAKLNSFDADGFTLGKTGGLGGGKYIGYLALKGGQFHVGNATQPTAPGDQDITAPGFPVGGILTLGHNTTVSITNHNRLSVGAGDLGSDYAGWVGDTHGVMPSSSDWLAASRAIIHADSDAPASPAAAADLTAALPTGFRLNWPTADAVARQFLYLALEQYVAPSARRIFTVHA